MEAPTTSVAHSRQPHHLATPHLDPRVTIVIITTALTPGDKIKDIAIGTITIEIKVINSLNDTRITIGQVPRVITTILPRPAPFLPLGRPPHPRMRRQTLKFLEQLAIPR